MADTSDLTPLPVDLDDIVSLRQGLLQRDLLLEKTRKELVLVERWIASVFKEAGEVAAQADNARTALLEAMKQLPDELAIASEIDDLRYVLEHE